MRRVADVAWNTASCARRDFVSDSLANTRGHTERDDSYGCDTLADNETYPCDSDLMCPRTTVYNAVVITGRPTTSQTAHRQQFTNITADN